VGGGKRKQGGGKGITYLYPQHQKLSFSGFCRRIDQESEREYFVRDQALQRGAGL